MWHAHDTNLWVCLVLHCSPSASVLWYIAVRLSSFHLTSHTGTSCMCGTCILTAEKGKKPWTKTSSSPNGFRSITASTLCCLQLEEFNCKQSEAVPEQICITVEIKPVKAAIIWIDSVIDLPKGDWVWEVWAVPGGLAAFGVFLPQVG